MSTPGESILHSAEQKLDEQQAARELLRRRSELTDPIDATLDVIKTTDTVHIDNYIGNSQDILNLTVSYETTDAGFERSNGDTIMINGRLRRDDTSIQFPMYKVTRLELWRDGFGKAPDHYEVAVADPESRSGYRPIALVEQSILNEHNRTGNLRVKGDGIHYDHFKSHSALDSLDLQELEKTGIYVDPRSTDMLGEVWDILRRTRQAITN